MINQIYFFQHQTCNQSLQKNEDSNKVHHNNNVDPAYHWQTFLKKQTKQTKDKYNINLKSRCRQKMALTFPTDRKCSDQYQLLQLKEFVSQFFYLSHRCQCSRMKRTCVYFLSRPNTPILVYQLTNPQFNVFVELLWQSSIVWDYSKKWVWQSLLIIYFLSSYLQVI